MLDHQMSQNIKVLEIDWMMFMKKRKEKEKENPTTNTTGNIILLLRQDVRLLGMCIIQVIS